MDKYGQYILLLFDRPCEPLFIPKGDQKINFDLTANQFSKEYQGSAQIIQGRFGEESSPSVKIPEIENLDLSYPLSLDRKSNFSLFIESHRKRAVYLIKIFMQLRTVQELLYVAASCRDRMNSQMFVYVLSVTLIHRPDTKYIQIPLLSEIFPDKFLDSSVVSKAKQDAIILPAGSRIPIEFPLDYTATDVDPEHRVAYWREDIGINLHHWHWHLVYPFDGPEDVVNRDRRGELFYYMHHQVMARFNVERFCNELGLTRPLNGFRDPVSEAYFPKLDQTVAGRSWPSRPANMLLSDINRAVDLYTFKLTDIETYLQRVAEAIRTRTVITKDGSSYLSDVEGINILGNMVEASPVLSINSSYYGDIHNLGHMALAYCHDPDHRYLESFAVMGDPSTAMRDPIFYRWHTLIDNVFSSFKDCLTPYTREQLKFPRVKILEIGIISKTSNRNTINTHWTQSNIDLSRGLDFTPRGPILARVQHLNHKEFTYIINVKNTNKYEVIGTVRIFIAPTYDENGQTFNFNDQRKLMIEMDKFVYKMKRGINVIQRNSTESSVTIPFESTFRNLEKDRPSAEDLKALSNYSYCGCGWPQHMLVPKGNLTGYSMDLFVMISDYTLDKVEQSEQDSCRVGVSYCGLKNSKYPDARAMGFPFDRTASALTLNEFCIPNMLKETITVRFNNVIEQRN